MLVQSQTEIDMKCAVHEKVETELELLLLSLNNYVNKKHLAFQEQAEIHGQKAASVVFGQSCVDDTIRFLDRTLQYVKPETKILLLEIIGKFVANGMIQDVTESE